MLFHLQLLLLFLIRLSNPSLSNSLRIQLSPDRIKLPMHSISLTFNNLLRILMHTHLLLIVVLQYLMFFLHMHQIVIGTPLHKSKVLIQNIRISQYKVLCLL